MKQSGQETDKVETTAQEAKEVIPQSVAYNDDSGLHYMDKSKLVPVLVKAIQEQQQMIDELKAQVEALDGTL